MSSDEVAQMVQHFAHAAELRSTQADGEIHGAKRLADSIRLRRHQPAPRPGAAAAKTFRFPLAVIDAIDEMAAAKPPRLHHRLPFARRTRRRRLTMADTLALVDALAAKPLQYLHVSLWDFYKKRAATATTNTV